MKKNQVNAILVNQTKRKNKIFTYICCIFLMIIISLTFLLIYFENDKDYLVNYQEDSNIDYKVYLKENDFFDTKYLDKNNNYIASLIDYIKADFSYKISMEQENIEYRYLYRIESDVSVKEVGSNKPLYTDKQILLEVANQYANSSNNVFINESLDIDYNKYNNLIKKFISIYGLNDINSTLTISMYIDVVGSCDEFNEDTKNETIISLSIPLTTETMEIDIKNNLVEERDSVLICNDEISLNILYLFISIVVGLISIFLIYKLILYIIKTRTAETIYDIELKKILNYYHSYIQKVNNNFDLKKDNGLEIDNEFIYKGCQFFKLDAFTDMLEIRDSINAPILMSTNKENTATYFIILDVTNKAIYVYGLNVDDIKNKMINNTKKLKNM